MAMIFFSMLKYGVSFGEGVRLRACYSGEVARSLERELDEIAAAAGHPEGCRLFLEWMYERWVKNENRISAE
jgi:hypothetical protein